MAELFLFHAWIKDLFQNPKLVIIAFAVVTTFKSASFLSSPYGFTSETHNHSYFDKEERSELYQDFAKRTLINFIRTRQSVPQSIQRLIYKLTLGHVGYTSAIIHLMNENCRYTSSEEEILNYLGWPDLILQLMVQCHRKDLSHPEEEKMALHEIWEDPNGRIYLNNSQNREHYINLVRKGWLDFNEDKSYVEFICPVSKQMILKRLYLQF